MAASGDTAPCPSCGAALPVDSRFCPGCGTQLAAGETLKLVPDPVLPDARLAVSPPGSPPTVHHVHRRPFGVHPVPLLGGLASVALVAALAVFASGAAAGGAILLAVFLVLAALFVAGVRREPDAPGAGFARNTAGRAGWRLNLGLVSARAWAAAALRLLELRRRQVRLRHELKRRLKPLGEAVHRGDEQRAEALRMQAAELEQKLDEVKRDASAVIAAARREVERERATAEPTRTLGASAEQ